jgi:hypothetical protein
MEALLNSTATQGLGVILSIYFVWYITKTVTTRLDKIEQNQKAIADALIKIVERQDK